MADLLRLLPCAALSSRPLPRQGVVTARVDGSEQRRPTVPVPHPSWREAPRCGRTAPPAAAAAAMSRRSSMAKSIAYDADDWDDDYDDDDDDDDGPRKPLPPKRAASPAIPARVASPGPRVASPGPKLAANAAIPNRPAAALSPPPAPRAADPLVARLAALGFEETDCAAALAACGRDLDAAADFLCAGHATPAPPPGPRAAVAVGGPSELGRQILAEPPERRIREVAPVAAGGSALAGPSPDDAVLAAQAGRLGGGARPPAVPSPPPRNARGAQPESQNSGLESQNHGLESVAGGGLGGRRLSLQRELGGAGAGESPDSSDSGPAPKSLDDFVPDPSLMAAAAAAAAAGGQPPLHLLVMGHIDAGKSSLMGRLLVLLGAIDGKTAHGLERDAKAAGQGASAWAWALDSRPEERTRGITTDVAHARLVTARYRVCLMDSPGHRDFVPHMIAGAAAADAAILVADGAPGGFESGFSEPGPAGAPGAFGGQTREHAQLARALGVDQLVVAVTKMDACGYSAARFSAIQESLAPFLRGIGYKDAAVRWVPVSAMTNENLTSHPRDHRLAAWWGPAAGADVALGAGTLMDAIDGFTPPGRAVGRPLRLPVTETFTSRALGQVAAAGKVEAGAIRPGQRVLVLPAGLTATVKAVEVGGVAVTGAWGALAGEAAAVGLAGIDPAAVAPGSVLCSPEWPLALAARVELKLLCLEIKAPLLKGSRVILHAHALQEPAVITDLVARLDAKTGAVEREHPRVLTRGMAAFVVVSPGRRLPLERFVDCRALGRAALREGGRTLAVGIVTRVWAE